MTFDIKILKGSFDSAFNMYGAVYLSELGAMEHEWIWKIEKDPVAMLIGNFVKDFQSNFALEKKKREKQISVGLTKHVFDLMKEIICLRQHLWRILEQMEFQLNAVRALGRSFVAPIKTSVSDDDDHLNFSNFNSKVKEERKKDIHKDGEEEDSGYFVAKMIKNQNWKRRELEPTFKKGKDVINPKGMIEEAVLKLDNLISMKARLCENFWDEQLEESCLLQLDVANEKKLAIDNLEDVQHNMLITSVSDGMEEERSNEPKILREEKQDADLQTMIVEDTCVTPFKSLISGFYTELHNCELWSLIKEDICDNLIKEMENEEYTKIENDKTEGRIREDIYYIVFSEALKDILCSLHDIVLHKERLVKEGTYKHLIKEMINEENKKIEACKIDTKIKEDIYYRVFTKATEDLLSSFHDAAINEVSLKKEDMSKNLFKEMIKEEIKQIESCKIDTKIGEDIYYSVFSKATEDLLNILHDAAISEASLKKEDTFKKLIKEMINEESKKIESYKIDVKIREDIYDGVFSKVTEDLFSSLHDAAVNEVSLKKEDIYKNLIKEMINKESQNIESWKIDVKIRDDIYHRVFSKATKDPLSSLCDTAINEAGLEKEDICKNVIKEMLNEESKKIESCKTDGKITEDIYSRVFNKTTEDFLSSVLDGAINEVSLQKEDTSKNLIKEMINKERKKIESCKIDMKIREDIYYRVFHKATEDLLSSLHDAVINEEAGLEKEDMSKKMIKEMINEESMKIESCKIDGKISEDMYSTVFSKTTEDLSSLSDIVINEVSLQKEDTCRKLIKEMINEASKKIESCKIDAKIGEDMYYRVFSKATEDLLSSLHDAATDEVSLKKEDMHKNLIKEMINEGSEKIESCKIDMKIGEDIYYGVFSKAIEDLLISLHDATINKVSLEKEDMHKKLIKQMINEESKKIESCKIDTKIRDDIYHGVFSKATKDLLSSLCDTARNEAGLEKEGICNNVIKEMLNEESKIVESCKIDGKITEDIYSTVYNKTTEDFLSSVLDGAINEVSLQKEDTSKNLIKEMINKERKKIESCKIDVKIRDDIYYRVFNKATKDLLSSLHDAVINEEVGLEEEDMCKKIIKEMKNEESKKIEGCKIDGKISEDMHSTVFSKTTEDLSSLSDIVINEVSLQKEDTCRKLIKEMINEASKKIESCKIDAKIGEDMYYRVFSKATEDLLSSLHDAATDEVSLKKEDMHKNLIKEMINEGSERIESCKIDMKIGEDIYYGVFSKAIEDLLISLHDAAINKVSLEKEDMHKKLIKQMINEESKKIESCKIDTKIREDIYYRVFSKVTENLLSSLHDNEVNLRKVDMCKNLIEEMINEEIKKIESCKINVKIREDIYYTVFSEATKDILSSLHDVALVDYQGNEAKNNCLKDALSDEKLMANLREGVYITILREMHKDGKESTDIYNDGLFRLEMNQIVFGETIKDVVNTANCILQEFERIKIPENPKFKMNAKLGVITSRLEDFKVQLHPLVEQVTLLRKKELLYRTAFFKRCENLRRAEGEVDELGDQVDKLRGLLKKIYLTLRQHSPLSESSEVLEILKLIKQELVAAPDSSE